MEEEIKGKEGRTRNKGREMKGTEGKERGIKRRG